MHHTIPRSLCVLTDDQLLDRALEPEFMHQRTPLEVEVLWRLAEAHHIIEQAHAEQRRMLAALASSTCSASAHELKRDGSRASKPRISFFKFDRFDL